MNKEFDLNNWEDVAVKLKRRYPQLTDADLIWRHETKDDFYKIIAVKLRLTMNQMEDLVAEL
jgi:hypothetical protein